MIYNENEYKIKYHLFTFLEIVASNEWIKMLNFGIKIFNKNGRLLKLNETNLEN